MSVEQLIEQGYAVPVYRVCPECKGGGRMLIMDGRNNNERTCATCKGQGTLDKRYVRLRDLPRRESEDG